MKSVTFCFATHNHQPIGNFDHVIEEAYRQSYLPFFELAEKYPEFRFGTHFTGVLVDWVVRHHSEHVELLRTLVRRGQLEIITGGFYEPILSVIPPSDQQTQIARLTESIRERYNYEATGMWLAERVWEQPLASSLARAGVKYVLLDDTHFLSAGLTEAQLNGYYLTEDQGRTLAVFPISKALRYSIPFQSVDETIRVLRDAASGDGGNIVCFADDGEKFGVWPRTHKHVYEDGWLEEFFRKVTENSNWLRSRHLSEAMHEIKPKGRIYLPTASYAEMLQWALPTLAADRSYEELVHRLEHESESWERYRPFVRGGYWRNFFAKYPESNQLHKHMLRTSRRLHTLNGQGVNVREAYDALLASQCNDPYWHGVFGGVYLTNLRHANFSSLVRADRLLDEAEGAQGLGITFEDVDCDGADEVILETEHFGIYVKPSMGGMISEFDYKPADLNVMNTLTRREEAYHHKLAHATTAKDSNSTRSIHDMIEAKEEGLSDQLVYDWYRRGSMIEHILPEAVSLEELRQGKLRMESSFVNSCFDATWNNDTASLWLSARIRYVEGEKEHQVRLEKSLGIQQSDLFVIYRLSNESAEPVRLRLASEWVINLLSPDATDRYFLIDGKKPEDPRMRSSQISEGAGKIELLDEWLGVRVSIQPDEAQAIVRYPIESVSLSEGGFEKVYQGSVVMPIWSISLAPAETWTGSLSLSLSRL
jgi:alpha-amylase/alpha-mannosidase (GH57 family)